jgi:hypothetical protein
MTRFSRLYGFCGISPRDLAEIHFAHEVRREGDG